MNKLFNIAVRASSIHDRACSVWVAPVTPAEAIELINAGANPSGLLYNRKNLIAMMKAGKSNKIWFYFKVATNSRLAKYLCVEKRHG